MEQVREWGTNITATATETDDKWMAKTQGAINGDFFHKKLVLGYSPLKTGLSLIPMDTLILILNPFSGKHADRYGGRILTMLGLAFDATALIWFSTLGERSSYSTVLGSHTVGGERISSSPWPKISLMFCGDAETPVLCRQLMHGGREPEA